MSERAVKHTYICATDSWAKEETTVSIAPHSFARGGMRRCHECAETADGYRTDSVAKFSLIHRGSGARAAAFAEDGPSLVVAPVDYRENMLLNERLGELTQPLG